MREQTVVKYELEIMCNGVEFTEEFSHVFDSELYEVDIDGTDLMMVNFKMNELKEKYGEDLLLVEFSIDRDGILN